MSDELRIPKLNMGIVQHDSVVAMFGKRRCGKTTLVLDLLYHHRSIPRGIIISATEESNMCYQQIMPSIFIFSEYVPDVVEKFIAKQKKLVAKFGKTPDTRAFILLDDCMYDSKRITKDANIRYLFMNGRHLNVLFILTAQFLLDFPPALRTNVDYVFACQELNRDNKERLYKYFFGVFPNLQTFATVHDQCTENYECLVLNNTVKTNKIESVICWYKAVPDRKFKLCSPEVWRYARRYQLNAQEQEELEVSRENAKNRVKVMVRKLLESRP